MKLNKQNSTFSTRTESAESLPFVNNRDLLMSELAIFDLDEVDSTLYLSLLHTGPLRVSSISAKTGLDRGKVYRSIDRLRHGGLVTTSFSNPTICSPVDPAQALKTVIERKHDELYCMKKISEKIMPELREIQRRFELLEKTFFTVIRSRLLIYNKIGKMIQDSKKGVIYMVTPADDLVRMYHTAIPEKIRQAAKSDTTVCILTEDDLSQKVLGIIKKFGASEVRTGKLPSKGRMVVERNRQVIMSGVTGKSADLNNVNDTAIHTNSVEIVCNVDSLCEHLWDISNGLTVGYATNNHNT